MDFVKRGIVKFVQVNEKCVYSSIVFPVCGRSHFPCQVWKFNIENTFFFCIFGLL